VQNVDGGCELLLGGLLAQGYIGNSSLTAQRFSTDDQGRRWYMTGDLVRNTSKHGYEFLGRRDRQTKVRGYRIELSDIEAAARRQSGVVDVACTVLERAGGPEIWAFVACQQVDAPHAAHDVERGLRAALPAHMVPSRIITLNSLPLSANGKIDHATLIEQHTCGGRGEIAKPNHDIDGSGRRRTED
jgi:acyl-coenzyme A synthetase/AMP-(fatty) acid ligase